MGVGVGPPQAIARTAKNIKTFERVQSLFMSSLMGVGGPAKSSVESVGSNGGGRFRYMAYRLAESLLRLFYSTDIGDPESN